MRYQIVSNPIFMQDIVQDKIPDHHGAESFFCGVVRNTNLGRQVKAVEYEAFAPLAEQMFKTFTRQAKDKFGEDLCVWIVHRVGLLQVGDISVLIRVSSMHRKEACDAVRFVIETLKKEAPIWKKEFYTDGESEWVKGHSLCC